MKFERTEFKETINNLRTYVSGNWNNNIIKMAFVKPNIDF